MELTFLLKLVNYIEIWEFLNMKICRDKSYKFITFFPKNMALSGDFLKKLKPIIEPSNLD